MLKADTTYELWAGDTRAQDVEILGAVNGVAVVLIKGQPYRFSQDTGKALDGHNMELREPHVTDVAAISVYIDNFAANIDNESLSDADFRNYARTVIELMQKAL